MKINTMKELVTKILEDPMAHRWSLQGFGMFRLYLGEEARLHLWDDNFRVPGVSDIHTHPWDFASTVVMGTVRNLMYREAPPGATLDLMRQRLRCGEGGGLVGEPTPASLEVISDHRYAPGQVYVQKAAEIHQSLPINGTVTIVERSFKEDTEHADVYFEEDDGWVSAEPRVATQIEIAQACLRALKKIP